MIEAMEAGANAASDIPEDADDILHHIKALSYGLEAVLLRPPLTLK